MSLFKGHDHSLRCGVVIDVGSGSVGMAIVVSDETKKTYEVVWSHREYMLIKDAVEGTQALKAINTTIINALLELGGNGIKSLHQYNAELSVKHIQVALSAPWAYTVTKTINFEDEHPFEVSKKLIDELITATKNQSAESATGEILRSGLGLRIITDDTVNVELNGYTIEHPEGHFVRSVSLAHITVLAQEKILITIEESIGQLFPKAKIEYYSFMYLFYRVLKKMHPDTSEICLIDVTNEATEIGIVRDNILKQVTHAPLGLYTIAREIAKDCNILKEEAYAFMKTGSVVHKDHESQLTAIYAAYEKVIAELFKKTGDSLSIPKTLFLHSSKLTEEFFSSRLKKAASEATYTEHKVHLFTSELLGGENKLDDTALALSAHYFNLKETYEKPDQD